MKQFLALILSLCMLCCCVSFAESDAEVVNGTYKTGLKIAAEPITLRVAVARHTADQSPSYNAKPFVKRSVEDTGLNFEFIEMITDVSAQLSVMLASGDDMPDVFLCDLGDLYEKNKDLFADLSGMIDEWAPNMKAYYDEIGADWGLITEEDGSIHRLLTGMYTNPGNIPGAMMWIDTSWLENVGMEMPTTTDELYEVLKAFKEQDANGDGDPNNEIPLDFREGVLTKWAVSWGAAGVEDNVYYVVKDGKVEPTANTEGYRAFLEFFHKLYAEGLLNPEGFTQTPDQYNASLKSRLVGCWVDWSPQMQRGTSPEADLCCALPVITAEGFEYLYPANNSIACGRNFAISATSKHKEAALRWWDYLSSTDELRWLTARGPEGLCWQFGDDGVTHYVYSPSPEEAQAVLDANGMDEFDPSMPGAAFYMDSHFPLIEKNTSYAPPVEGGNMSQGYMRFLGQQAIGEENFSDPMSLATIPSDINEELTFECEGMSDFINAFRADAIIKGVTDESWNAYVEELASYNYDYYLKVYQMKLDNNFEG